MHYVNALMLKLINISLLALINVNYYMKVTHICTVYTKILR